MRIFILILASLFAFGAPEVRASESLEETAEELVVSLSSEQSTAAKRIAKPAPAPQSPLPVACASTGRHVDASAEPEALFIRNRVLRL
jgi:hypothetical protein